MYVKFDKIADDGYNLRTACFTDIIPYADYLTLMDEVNFKIMSILNKHKASLAYKSQTVYFRVTAPNYFDYYGAQMIIIEGINDNGTLNIIPDPNEDLYYGDKYEIYYWIYKIFCIRNSIKYHSNTTFTISTSIKYFKWKLI